MAKAKKLPSGRWRCYVYSHTDPDGKRHYESFTASTKKEAEYMAAEFALEKKGLNDSRRWTLGEAIDKYINLKRPVLSPSSIYRYEKIRKSSFQDLMGVALIKIDSNMLQQAVNKEMERTPLNRTGTVSPKTVKIEYGLIASVLKRYMPEKTFHVDLPKQARRIRSLPLPEDIYEAVRDTDIELPVLLAMWLSFTVSEIRGLTKSKSIDGDYITIREVLVNVGGEDVRKEIAKEVTRNRRHRMPYRIRELVEKVDGDVIVPMKQKTLLYRFRKCLRKHDIEEITFHDLRHINASVMAALRIPDVYAQERGGWKTDNIMKSVYTETFSEERVKADKIVDMYFENFVMHP